MVLANAQDEYRYFSTTAEHTSGYVWGPVIGAIRARFPNPSGVRVVDIGAGNGAFAATLAASGFEVTAVEPSESGVEQAKRSHAGVRVHKGSAYDDLAPTLGAFAVVTCLEVIEHCYLPRHVAKTIWALLEPGGVAIFSTPYHGYLKNLALALTGKMDDHFTPLWDHGHIKFWSVRTLTALLTEIGFSPVEITRVGRVAPLAKSMIAVATKPRLSAASSGKREANT